MFTTDLEAYQAFLESINDCDSKLHWEIVSVQADVFIKLHLETARFYSNALRHIRKFEKNSLNCPSLTFLEEDAWRCWNHVYDLPTTTQRPREDVLYMTFQQPYHIAVKDLLC